MKVKKYLMSGVAALAIGLSFAGCSGDDLFTQEDAIKNAEEVLGISIDADRNWNMATQVTANVTVKLGLSLNYTVMFYEENPQENSKAIYYSRENFYEGEAKNVTFTIPKAVKTLYAVVYDSYNRSLVKQVAASDNLTVNFGGEEPTRSKFVNSLTRTLYPEHDFSADVPEKPTTMEMADANFKENANGITKYSGGFASNNSAVYIDGTENEINIWPGGYNDPNNYNAWVTYGGELYVTGNCDFSGKNFQLPEKYTIYLVKNSHLTINNGLPGNCKVYLSEGSTLTVNNTISTGNVSYYSKGGSIEAKNGMVINGENELFMEGGSLKVGGQLFQLEPATCYLHNTAVEISGKLDVNHGWDNALQASIPALYYQEGGSFKATGHELVCNSGTFYIDVNSSFSSIEANGTGIIVNNAGTMTSASTIRVTNNNSVLINNGNLTGAYLGTEGSAHFQNNGNATITGNTIVNSNNNTWVNNGQYRTQYFIYNAGSSDVINNCHMVVDEDFNINLGDNPGTSVFRMDSGSSVETKNFNGGKFSYSYFRTDWNTTVNENFNGGPFRVVMGSNSVFKVSQTATMCATKPDYGIYGPESGDFAVFQAQRIAAGRENQGFLVTYSGNLAVVADMHFLQGNDGDPTHPFYVLEGSATIYQGDNKPAFSIAAEEPCNPGFNPGTPGTDIDIPGSPGIWSYAFEDSYHADYDMNDVVIRVQEKEGDASKLIVTLCCTGASYNLTVNLTSEQGVVTRIFNGTEVHAVLGCASGKFVNTGTADNNKFFDAVFQTTEINKPSDFTFGTADFWIQSPEGEMHVSKTGQDPHGIIVPGDWAWPLEFTSIKVAYPQFSQYFIDGGVNEEYEDWYNHPDESKVYRIQE